MEKIGIITLNGYFNYGNRLQNYALQEVLKTLEFDVETIIIDIETDEVSKNAIKFTDRILRIKEKDFTDLIGICSIKLWKKLHKKEILKSNLKRNEIFRDFTKKYINETNFVVSNEDKLYELSNNYNFFVVGSDQVWNPKYNKSNSSYFLTFTQKEKRISYSASFGVSTIPKSEVSNYSSWINGMNYISVREEAGAEIVKKISNRRSFVHVDPTLLLTKEEWMCISETTNNKNEGKYLLTYFLGTIPKGYKNKIKFLAKKYKLEIINLGNIREKETYRTGPSEFINYIKNCSIFCTDSFHGTVFSILFEKPFIVYERKDTSISMFSRIETLLNKFNLNSRIHKNINYDKDIFNIDYSRTPEILKEEREKSFNYLQTALHINNGEVEKKYEV